jgi:hypothetical protein
LLSLETNRRVRANLINREIIGTGKNVPGGAQRASQQCWGRHDKTAEKAAEEETIEEKASTA